MANDTIAAIATALGQSAVGIVRMSGPAAFHIAGNVFSPNTPGMRLSEMSGKRGMFLGRIIDNGMPIDETLMLAFKGPFSYTGEDVIEFHCHGSVLLLNRLMDILIRMGCRVAQPGEFTRRAVMNGKMDLLQAEAVLSVITSASDLALQAGALQLIGGLSRQIRAWEEILLNSLSELEASINFLEDGDFNTPEMAQRLERLANEMQTFLEERGIVEALEGGLHIVIAGSANAGKSTLFNSIIGQEIAIVHDEAGTTRDAVNMDIMIDGVRVCLTDTAGLMPGPRGVDKKAIDKTLEAVKDCHGAIFVVDASDEMDNEAARLLDSLDRDKTILFLNKTDLPMRIKVDAFKGWDVVMGSALTKQGVPQLRERIAERFIERYRSNAAEYFLLRKRHITGIKDAVEAICVSLGALEAGQIDAASSLLFDAVSSLRQLTGEIVSDEVLDAVFRDFCIGK